MASLPFLNPFLMVSCMEGVDESFRTSANGGVQDKVATFVFGSG